MHVLSQSFARPADANIYTPGDLVANTTASGAVVVPLTFTPAAPTNRTVAIRRCRIKKTGTGGTVVVNAAFRLHLYTALPVPTNADNGVWLTTKALNYLGSLDVTVDRVFSDGAVGIGTPEKGTEIIAVLTAGSRLYGLLEARGAYTPGNGEVFTVELEVID